MVIGALKLSFHLHGIRSLKGKRQIRNRLVDRLRQRFKISIAEVEGADEHQRLVLGISVVSGDFKVVDRLLEQLIDAAESEGLAPVTAVERETFRL